MRPSRKIIDSSEQMVERHSKGRLHLSGIKCERKKGAFIQCTALLSCTLLRVKGVGGCHPIDAWRKRLFQCKVS